MQSLLIRLVKFYRFALSPWLGSGCRFTPTCSAYAVESLALHGAKHGTYLTLKRIARCHPWCDGGIDLVPRYTHQQDESLLNNHSPSTPHSQQQ